MTTQASASASNYYVTQFYQHALALGLDANKLLADSGIPLAVIGNPEKRVAAIKFSAFILAIWDELQDESMGLSPEKIPRGSFYLMGKLTVHEQSLGSAIKQIIRFYSMVTRAFEMRLDVADGIAFWEMRMRHPASDPHHLLAEINLMSWHRYSSWLIAEHIPMAEVYFDYPVPPQVEEYRFLFPGEHRFESDCMGFSFSSRYLNRPIKQSLSSLRTFMSNCPMELLMQPKTDFSLTAEVRTYLLRSGRCPEVSLGEAADYCHMTERTLIRKLKEEGTSFRAIKEQYRKEYAIHLLLSTEMDVAAIAEKTGYSEPSVFARAFRVWTGATPTGFRQRSKTN